MDYREIVLNNRSYRRFDGSHNISKQTLLDLVDLARNTPSAGNRQLLRYVISGSPEYNEKIFETVAWAASLPDWPGPEEGERPMGYIVITGEKTGWDWLRVDLGIAAQTILLGASALGLGGCMLGSIRKQQLARILNLNDAITSVIPGLSTIYEVDNAARASDTRPLGISAADTDWLRGITDDRWANLPRHYTWLRDWEAV